MLYGEKKEIGVMTSTDFFDAVKEEVLAIVQEQCGVADAYIQTVIKANGLVCHGLTLKGKSNMAPVIYLDDFYNKYEEGIIDMSKCAEMVADIYRESRWNGDFDIKSIHDFEKVKDRIVLGIYNTEANAEILADMPHKEFKDLSLYYRIEIAVDKKTTGFITVHNKFMDAWGKDLNEIHALAWSNMKRRNPSTFRSMNEVLQELCDTEEDVLSEDEDTEPQLFVLSSANNVSGAVYMADMQELAQIADVLEKDFVLLPSSRHEVIIVPMDDAYEDCIFDKFKSMVREVNETELEPEDYLSDNVYFFNRATKELKMVA